MFAWKKKSNTLLAFFALMIILSSVSVLAETAYFYWYDAGGTLCATTNAGALTEGGVTTNTGSAPTSNPTCCNIEGTLTVDYYTDYGEWYSAKYNGGIRVQAYTVNWDANLRDCTCYGKSWSIGGDIGACCGDDANEYKLTRNCNSWCTNDGSDDACCSANNKCVYSSTCYSSGSCYSNNAYCNSGTWYDSDSNPSYCTSCVGTGRWSVGGEVAATNCCGDDPNEYYITQGSPGQTACCFAGGPNICVSSYGQCRGEWGGEVTCRDGLDNDCDDLSDCSDPDCSLSLDCIGCFPESEEASCNDGIDNDCDNYIDCLQGNSDEDCVNSGSCDCSPENTETKCSNNIDDDCDGKTDCTDNSCLGNQPCPENCVEENTVDKCKDGLDNDCDGFKDYLDRDCGGCGMGKKICSDGSCKESCDPAESQGCVGTANGNCEEGEGCACADCFGKTDSCEKELICNPNTDACSCPSGTTICSDGKCRKKCFVCGDGILEEGEECDGSVFGGLDQCTEIDFLFTEGVLSCSSSCLLDTSGCTLNTQDSDGDGIPDWWEIQNGLNPNDPSDALEDPDGDGLNNWEEYLRGTNPFNPDTDGDGLNDKIDPYPLNPTNTNNNLCGNSIIDSGETCDGANLGVETCADMFGSGYGGVLTCFNTDDGEKSCHLDTSGCFKTPLVCTGQKPCSSDKNCGCSECVGEQSSCNYGSVCDTTSKCACIDGTTLCKDSTCRTPQSCKDIDGGEQSCITQNNVCDPGEGCGCPDCEDKKGPCNALSICKNGVCTGCFLKRAYWADVKTGEEEDCIGSGNEIKMTAEGTPGCKDKTIMFKLKEPPTDVGDAVFKNSKAELVWKAEPEGDYELIASLKGDSDEIRSTKLEVEYCIRECDADCDQYCETESCVNDNPSYCKNMIEEGIIVLDANALSPWCEDCDPYGLSKGQETCAAYYDCTPGWWGSTTPQGWDEQMKQDAMNYLEWGDCGESKGATGTGRQQATGSMRNRLVCPPGLPLSIGECCAEQSKCYCKLPDFSNPKVKKLNCNLPQFRPTEIKGCLAEEKFPFFTNMNILIVVLILVSFYIWKNREKAKTKR